jgi:hypothetical protein
MNSLDAIAALHAINTDEPSEWRRVMAVLTDAGMTDEEIGTELAASPRTLARWRTSRPGIRPLTRHLLKRSLIELFAARAALASIPTVPIPLILHCPKCGLQHIDAPDGRTPEWTNPPHKSHLCHGCGCIWRPCDQPTEGVATIETSGKADNWVGSGATPAVDMREAAAKVAERFGVAMKKREGEHLASARDAQSIAGREVANEYAVGYAKMASTAARIAAAIRDLPVGGGS